MVAAKNIVQSSSRALYLLRFDGGEYFLKCDSPEVQPAEFHSVDFIPEWSPVVSIIEYGRGKAESSTRLSSVDVDVIARKVFIPKSFVSSSKTYAGDTPAICSDLGCHQQGEGDARGEQEPLWFSSFQRDPAGLQVIQLLKSFSNSRRSSKQLQEKGSDLWSVDWLWGPIYDVS
jgi:hypothetical protein